MKLYIVASNKNSKCFLAKKNISVLKIPIKNIIQLHKNKAIKMEEKVLSIF